LVKKSQKKPKAEGLTLALGRYKVFKTICYRGSRLLPCKD